MRKNKKDKKQDINYLDLIPETNQSIRWHRDLKQRIILEIENKVCSIPSRRRFLVSQGFPRFILMKWELYLA